MKRPDFKAIWPNELDAEVCEGYYDGMRIDSPEPGPNRHPAYIHGFINGREDIGVIPVGETLKTRYKKWDYIVATCSDE